MTLRSILAASAILIPSMIHAQNPAQRQILDLNPQFELAGAAALADFNSANISLSEVSCTKDNGAYVGIDGSSDSWMEKARAESYARVTDRMVFFGGLSYSYFKGANMSGSALRDMYYNPVAFLEPSTEYAGVKTRELYSVNGALSYAISDKWAAGFSIGYESGNNVKTRDPRYRSEWMSMDLNASIWFKPKDGFSAGMSLIYRNTQEILKSHIYGIAATQYLMLIDRGACFGTLESVDTMNGVVSNTTFLPMTNNFYGAAFQLKNGSYYGDLEALYRKGQYGLNTSADPQYFKHMGVEVTHRSRVVIDNGSNSHIFHADASYKFLKNSENSFKYTTSAGSNTVVTYNGTKDVLSRHDITANVGYKGSTGISEGKPSVQFGADADMQMRLQRTTVFPLYRDHRRTSVAARAFADKYIFKGADTFRFGASLNGGAGFGVAAKDGKLAASTGGGAKGFDTLLNRQFEYETAPFAGVGLVVSYTHELNKRMSCYVSLRDDFSALLKTPSYLDGRTRNSAILCIGLNL